MSPGTPRDGTGTGRREVGPRPYDDTFGSWSRQRPPQEPRATSALPSDVTCASFLAGVALQSTDSNGRSFTPVTEAIISCPEMPDPAVPDIDAAVVTGHHDAGGRTPNAPRRDSCPGGRARVHMQLANRGQERLAHRHVVSAAARRVDLAGPVSVTAADRPRAVAAQDRPSINSATDRSARSTRIPALG